MEYAQRIASLVLSLRKKDTIRVRQPLQRILLPVLNDTFREEVEGVKDLILAETNVKELEYISDTSGLITKKIKPNFKTLGKILGKQMKDAAPLIENMTQEEIAAIEKTGGYDLQVNGETFHLSPEDFIITSEDLPGWQVMSEGGVTVALDTTLSPTLLAEGTARELVNRIQNIRKSQDFNVSDKVLITLEDMEAIRPAVEEFRQYICNETLAVGLVLASNVEAEKVDLFDDLALGIKVEISI